MQSPLYTRPPEKPVVLYDGSCKFCTVHVKKLLALAQPGAIEALSFQEPGILDRFPGLSHEACMQAMQLITPEGRIYTGFEAAVRALATRRLIGWLAYLYYLPGVRQLCNWLYRWIAANRYRFLGKTVANQACPEGTCSLHAGRQ